jgi:8-oxo-dGTP pyrophosphatase MutT (NUDIX family)
MWTQAGAPFGRAGLCYNDFMIKHCTLCFLINKEKKQVCLGYKKRGFGEGKWNGVGGKIDPGETMEQAMIRETKEEFDVDILESDLEKVGVIDFHFEADDVADILGNIYMCQTWRGEPAETEEMRPSWFSFHEIPLEDMWDDDKYWLPQVLEGKKIKAARFIFDGEQNFLRTEKLEFE